MFPTKMIYWIGLEVLQWRIALLLLFWLFWGQTQTKQEQVFYWIILAIGNDNKGLINHKQWIQTWSKSKRSYVRYNIHSTILIFSIPKVINVLCWSIHRTTLLLDLINLFIIFFCQTPIKYFQVLLHPLLVVALNCHSYALLIQPSKTYLLHQKELR